MMDRSVFFDAKSLICPMCGTINLAVQTIPDEEMETYCPSCRWTYRITLAYATQSKEEKE